MRNHPSVQTRIAGREKQSERRAVEGLSREAGTPRVPRRKFTLIELLIVIAVIMLLISLLLPALGKAKEFTRSSVCQNNMRQFGVNIYQYTNDYDDWMPVTCFKYSSDWIATVTGDSLAARPQCPSAPSEIDWTNYMYNLYLGTYYASWGYPSNPNLAPRKLTRCRMPSGCSVLIDGKCKTSGGSAFDYTCNTGDVMRQADRYRHNYGINSLFADSHVAWDNFRAHIFTGSDIALKNAYYWNNLTWWPP
jgi:type II secretory pathway pseudopilin PulG